MAWRQTIIWTNDGILLIGPLGTNFSETLIGIQTFPFKKMHLKMSSAKWRPFCLGLNVLRITSSPLFRRLENPLDSVIDFLYRQDNGKSSTMYDRKISTHSWFPHMCPMELTFIAMVLLHFKKPCSQIPHSWKNNISDEKLGPSTNARFLIIRWLSSDANTR